MRLDTLNEKQRQAVITIDGPLLILAGAGSGKTRVLTHRIAYILEQGAARPEEILTVTFTNKAANEMKERIGRLLGGEGRATRIPWAGTFHSICAKILRAEGYLIGLGRNFTIYDPTDQLDVLKKVMEEKNISQKEVNPRAIHSFISSAKNEYILPEEYASYAKGYFQEIVASLYPEYERKLKENNAVDFDDLLLKVALLFEQHPEVLKKYQGMFKYILVDEYQDTNHVQYLLVKSLAEGHRNLCVVGDDDQSIYAFRGATIRNILNFERDYPEAEVVKLEQNYRSSKIILEAAYEVVRKNKGRTDKKLWTENEEGSRILLYTAETERDEADWLARQISTLISDSVEPEEIAVLYRTNAQSRALEEGLIKHSVAYRIVGGLRFYQRKEIKDVLAYMRVVYNPKDNTSLLRIINTPRRGIGSKSVDDLVALSQDKGVAMAELDVDMDDLNPKAKTFLTLVNKITNNNNATTVVDLINVILEETKYIQMLEDGKSENEARIENIKELISVAANYDQYNLEEGLAKFLEDVSLIEAESEDDSLGGKVTLMTIHAAKGLEFEYVFVVGMEEGLFPHSRVFSDPKELEEERRLAYVAITRAKKQLYLTHADSRIYFGGKQNNLLSRFAEDIPSKFLTRTSYSGASPSSSGWEEWEDDWSDSSPKLTVSVGERVRHEYFGVGTVVKFDDTMITINFGPVYGLKELAIEYAPLQVV